MKKTLLLLTLLSMTSAMAFAQLSTRENEEAAVFRLGTRPSAGTFGIYLGPSFTEIQDMVDNETNWRGLPYLNFKYYSSDNFVYRVGIQLHIISNSTSWETIERAASSGEEGSKYEVESFKNTDAKTHFRLTPGIEYHFSPKNLLDVYTGATLPIGFDRYSKTDETFQGANGTKNNVSQTPFTVGLGGYIGLQVFIADLPLALGFEYGLTALFRTGTQYKRTIGQNGQEQVIYGLKEGEEKYRDLAVRKTEVGGDMRVTFSYFFN